MTSATETVATSSTVPSAHAKTAIRELAEEVEDLLAGAALLGAAEASARCRRSPGSHTPPPTGHENLRAATLAIADRLRGGELFVKAVRAVHKLGPLLLARRLRPLDSCLEACAGRVDVLKSSAQFCRSELAAGVGRGARHGHQDELEEALRRRCDVSESGARSVEPLRSRSHD